MSASELATRYHNPSLAEVEGSHVYQVWEDGEITLTKCGSLLGARTLHQMEPPLAAFVPATFPCPGPAGHSFAYVTREHAYEIRNVLLGY